MNESLKPEVLFFLSTFAVSALAGAFRCLRDGSYRGVVHLCSVSGVSGCLGFAIVALFGDRVHNPDFNGVWYMGVAAVVGLAGKEQTQLIEVAWKGVFKRLFPADD